MGKVLIDLDLQFANILKAYLFAFQIGKYDDAFMHLRAMNESLPSECYVSDMPQLESFSNSLRSEDEWEGYVVGMCQEFYPLIMRAIARYREEQIAELNS